MTTDTQIKQHILGHVLPQCFNAAVKAGAEIMKIYKHQEDYDISLKSDHTPITIADRVAHNTIKEYLGPTRIPVLSEEGREMLYNNECVASVLYVPYHCKMYIAVKEYGSFLIRDIIPQEEPSYQSEQIEKLMERLPLESARHEGFRVAVSRSHQTPETHARIEQLREEHPDLEIVEQGSSYKFCLLAEGNIDYYVRTTNTYEWDTAAGELILAEAGGSTLSYPEGEPLRYNKADLRNPWFEARCKQQ